MFTNHLTLSEQKELFAQYAAEIENQRKNLKVLEFLAKCLENSIMSNSQNTENDVTR